MFRVLGIYNFGEDVTVSSWRTISIYDGSSQECLFFAKFNTKKRSFRWLHIASQADTALFVTAKEKMRFVVRKYLQGKSVLALSIDKILPKDKNQNACNAMKISINTSHTRTYNFRLTLNKVFKKHWSYSYHLWEKWHCPVFWTFHLCL